MSKAFSERKLLAERIAAARNHAGLSQAALSKVLGLTRSSVSQWEGDYTEPAAANLRAIATKTGVNYEWLSTGRGEMLDGMIDEHLESSQVLSGRRPESGILELDVRAGLGGGGSLESQSVVHDGNFADPVKSEAWHFPDRFVREEIRAPENRVLIVETRGDSMTPTILSGDRVIVDTGHRLPSPDGIYAIRDSYGTIVVKRLQLLRRGDPPIIRIISDNKAHDPEEVGADEISIVGRVLWALKRL